MKLRVSRSHGISPVWAGVVIKAAMLPLILAMVLSTNNAVPLDTATYFQGLKPGILGFFLVSATVAFLIARISFSGSAAVLVVGFAAWSFLGAMIWKAEFSLLQSLTGPLWLVATLMLSPLWLQRSNYRGMARFFFRWMLVVLLFALSVYAIFGRELDTFNTVYQNRFSGGFENPNFFAQIPLTIMLALALSLDQKGKHYWKFILIAGAMSLVFSILAVSRSSALATLAFLFFVFFPRNASKWFSALLGAAGLTVILIVASYEQLTRLSSGRLPIWNEAFTSILDQGAMGILFGSRLNDLKGLATLSYSRLGTEGGTEVQTRFDNVFLQLFWDFGVLAVILYIIIGAVLLNSSKRLDGNLRVVWQGIFVAAVTQSFFITNQFAFFAPAPLFFMVFLALPLYVEVQSSAKQSRVNSLRGSLGAGSPI